MIGGKPAIDAVDLGRDQQLHFKDARLGLLHDAKPTGAGVIAEMHADIEYPVVRFGEGARQMLWPLNAEMPIDDRKEKNIRCTLIDRKRDTRRLSIGADIDLFLLEMSGICIDNGGAGNRL